MGQLRLQTSRYFILFMVISFLGWAVETVFFLICYGRLFDRGFMTLPFCTIYGFSFLLMYFLLGLPDSGKACPLLRTGRGTRWFRPAYFLLSALIPTTLELLTGLFFHRFFGIRLWDYSAYRFHFQGYICLEYTLLWGLLIPFCMKYFFAPLKQQIFRLSAPRARRLAVSIAVPAVLDWSLCFSHITLSAR